MMGRKGPKRGLARGVRDRKPGGSSWLRILCSVCQWMPYSWHAWRLLISPVRTRRRISAHASMSVYTPASCRTASDHGRDRYRTAGTALERYTSGSADRTSASAALLDRRLQEKTGKEKLVGKTGVSSCFCLPAPVGAVNLPAWDANRDWSPTASSTTR